MWTLFTNPVIWKQMSQRWVVLDWCIRFRWQFWVMAFTAYTNSSSGMSDKMILIPHINEINESEYLKAGKLASPFCLALK